MTWATPRGNRKELVLLGDSLIEYYDWQARFPDHRVVNLGLAGDTVQGLKARLPLIRQQAARPGWFCVMIGTNNVAMEDYGFPPDYDTIVAWLAQSYPGVPLHVTSLLPMTLPWLNDSVIPRLNDRLRAMAARSGATYIDVHAAFLAAPSRQPLFLEDGVHLGQAGYETWVAAMAPFLPAPA